MQPGVGVSQEAPATATIAAAAPHAATEMPKEMLSPAKRSSKVARRVAHR
jgi:hypothetical protein